MENYAVEASGLSKIYKIYNKRQDLVKEVFSPVKKSYHRDFYALDDVSFKVEKGHMLGILGENGAGKSTLLKILTGVTKPTGGIIAINGKIAALLELGAGFNQDYTGRENIFLNGMMMGFSRTEMENRVEPIVKFADIGDFIDQPVKNYSSGMFARLAFSVAINVEPDILIVDEALSVGDIFFQNKCFRKIESMRDKGVTILYVSHDLASIKEMCDEALWLDHGKAVMYGECINVCNEYSNALLQDKNELYDTVDRNVQNDVLNEKTIKEVKFPPIQYTNESILSDDVKIVSCYFTNNNGEIITSIHQGEHVKFTMIVDSYIDLDKVIAAYSIATVKGVWVANPNSLLLTNKHIIMKKGNRYVIDFSFTMPAIMAGEYVIEAAIANGIMTNYKTYTWLYGIQKIVIESDQNQYGLLNIPTEINVMRVG